MSNAASRLTDRDGATPQVGAELGAGARRVAQSLRRPSLSPLTIAVAAMAGDGAALGLGLWFAQYVSAQSGFAPVAAAGWACAGAIISLLLLTLARRYRLPALQSLPAGAGALIAAGALMLAGLFAMGMAEPDWLAALIALSAFALPARAMTAFATNWAVASGLTERRAVIVGGGEEAGRVITALAENPQNDIRICGLFDDRDDERSPEVVVGAPKLGRISQLVEFARIAEIDMVLISLPPAAERRILQIMRQLWVLPVDVRLSAYSSDCEFPRRWRAAPEQDGLVHLMRRPMEAAQRAAKRALDLAGASVALILFSPIMIATALAIRLESPGPVIFRQQRHGYNHKPVTVWKFRSMYVDQCDAQAVRVVTRGDPRVTRVGRVVRKTSIDELPQFFNVLGGSLSLVGPRPHALVGRSSGDQTFEQIVDGYSGRHKMKPGVTGWAQIHGWRGEIDAPEKLRKRFEHDLYYIENWSIWLDILILIRTPFSLFSKTENAY